MACKKYKRRDIPTFKTKKAAIRHGYIQHGRKRSGARKFRVYRVKGGWNVKKK